MPAHSIHYYALALQIRCRAVNALNIADARRSIQSAIDTCAAQVAASKGFIGPDTRLVVLPEYFLTGFPMGDPVESWAEKAGLDVDGPEYEALGKVCQDNDIYLSGNVYERDKAFPGLYFQASFIIAPNGDTVHRYRRLISLFAPTPHDVWERYLDLYGLEGVFPVTDTELGRLATVASEEILYPEITRAMALRGAEVILHSTSEVGSPELTPKDIAKRARAIENQAFVISANSGGITGTGIPEASTDGMSKIIDFNGHVLAAAGAGESMVANHEIDIAALRRCRRRPGMPSLLARQRLELYSHIAHPQTRYPANTLLDDTGKHVIPERSHFIKTLKGVIDDLIGQDLI